MMIDYISYQKTPSGKIKLEKTAADTVLLETLSVTAIGVGEYSVHGVGEVPEVGQGLLLPVKGALKVSLKLKVCRVECLINPPGAWKASCKGPEVSEFNLRTLDVICDVCKGAEKMEFIEYSGEQERDALLAMNMQGWQARAKQQICPSCMKNGQ